MPLLHQRSGISSASGGNSGFSVAAPVFSPRDHALSAAAAGGYGGLPPHLMAEQLGIGGGYGSRPGSAANSAFATPRDELRTSAEAETFEDALDSHAPAGEEGEEGPEGYGYSSYFGDGQEGEEETWGEAREGEVPPHARRDSLGLPSEASLFQDLPDFLRDTTDE
jgi:hypothetical protein